MNILFSKFLAKVKLPIALFFSILLFQLSFAQAPPNTLVTISGKITNFPPGSVASLDLTPNPLIPNMVSQIDTLDSEGNFTLSINLGIDYPATFSINEKTIPLYLFPGDELQITGNAKYLAKTVQFSGKGAANNNFLQEYEKEFTQKNLTYKFHTIHRERQAQAFRNYTDSLKQLEFNFIQTFHSKTPLYPTFKSKMQWSSIYEWAETQISYPYLHARYNKLDEAPQMPANWYAYGDTLSMNNNSMMTLPSYQLFLEQWLNHKMNVQILSSPNPESYDGKFTYADKYDLAQKLFKDYGLYYILGKTLSSAAVRSNIDVILPKFDHYLKNSKIAAYNQVVSLYYDKIKNLAQGNPASNFTLEDKNGKTKTLDDFKGKIVYIDFWASWCGPCKREMPHAQKLKSELKGEEIEFVYISMDRTKEAWQSYLEKNELNGTQLFIGDSKATVSENYAIKGIPKFVILDKNGNYLDAHARRPSDPLLPDELRKYAQTK